MSANDSELTPFFEAIKETVRERFGDRLSMLEVYEPSVNKKIKTPAVLIELVELKSGQQKSGGKAALEVELVAHCILGRQTKNIQVEVANFAAAFVLLLRRQRWGLSDFVEQAEGVSASMGMFKPDDDGFESMAVTWTQGVHIGDEWVLPDDQATEVYVGEAPAIGVDHQLDYERLT